jgi:hypothetical protein
MEQNQRHIMVLEELIEQTRTAPTRLGVVLRPKLYNVVVVQPSCSIVGNLPEDARIYRMDKLVQKIRGEDPSALAMLKMISAETLHGFAIDLVGLHKPAPKPKAVQREPTPSTQLDPTTPSCQGCGGPLTEAEARYCRTHSGRFGGRLLCRKCQSQPTPIAKVAVPDAQHSEAAGEVAARCAVCGAGVDKKVVAFCRFNSKRFGNRVLCRACQADAADEQVTGAN